MIRVLGVVGARPNFMKIAPLHRVMVQRGGFEPILVHTGQHYDSWMSDVFFDNLQLSPPEVHLGVGSGTHAQQTARVMLALEPVLLEKKPEVVVVVGDVNSTLAAALTAVKLWIPVAHVEAGLRSFDWQMPEEINRMVADAVSELLLAPSRDGVQNLLREGVAHHRIHLVGNVMIDSLLACLPRTEASTVLADMGLERKRYLVATIHRPENVDEPAQLRRAVTVLHAVARTMPTVLVAHPRTTKQLSASGLDEELASGSVRLSPPLGYLDFLALMLQSAAVLTDSGGIQEETTVLGVPCVTLRKTTERPITVTEGTNTVAGMNPKAVLRALDHALSNMWEPRMPELWDGRAAERIADILEQGFG